MPIKDINTHSMMNSGRLIDVLNIDPDDILLEDIAHNLSHQCRYNGATDKFYSVGYHSILMCWYIFDKTNDPMKALQALHHDDEEYLLGDMLYSLKPLFPTFVALSNSVRVQIFNKFGIDPDIDWLAEYDREIVLDEVLTFLTNVDPSNLDHLVGLGKSMGEPSVTQVRDMFITSHHIMLKGFDLDAQITKVTPEPLGYTDYLSGENQGSPLELPPTSVYQDDRDAAEYFQEEPPAKAMELKSQPVETKIIGDKVFRAIEEEVRQYIFKEGYVVINEPRWLYVNRQPEGHSHYIIDAEGESHYIPIGWLAISFTPTEGYLNFADTPFNPLQGVEASNIPTSDATNEWGTSKTGASREAMNKDNYDLVPFAEIVDAFVRVAEYGAIKYAPWNWSKGMSRASIMRSLLNHTFAYLRGEDTDEDKLNPDGSVASKGSGLSHTDHILWNAAALSHNLHHGLEDGRRAEPPRDYKPKPI